MAGRLDHLRAHHHLPPVLWQTNLPAPERRNFTVPGDLHRQSTTISRVLLYLYHADGRNGHPDAERLLSVGHCPALSDNLPLPNGSCSTKVSTSAQVNAGLLILFSLMASDESGLFAYLGMTCWNQVHF